MSNVTDIWSRKPHVHGEAECKQCGHKWEAMAPVGAIHLTCPMCKRAWGEFSHPFEPSWDTPRLVCSGCGGQLFFVTLTGNLCRGCGEYVQASNG